jgi:hypothetical protein
MFKKKLSKSPVKEPPPPCSPKRVPMDRDAPSPGPMVYSFMYNCQGPQKGAFPRNAGKTYCHHPRGSTQTEGLHTVGCGLVPQRGCLQCCCHQSCGAQCLKVKKVKCVLCSPKLTSVFLQWKWDFEHSLAGNHQWKCLSTYSKSRSVQMPTFLNRNALVNDQSLKLTFKKSHQILFAAQENTLDNTPEQ